MIYSLTREKIANIRKNFANLTRGITLNPLAIKKMSMNHATHQHTYHPIIKISPLRFKQKKSPSSSIFIPKANSFFFFHFNPINKMRTKREQKYHIRGFVNTSSLSYKCRSLTEIFLSLSQCLCMYARTWVENKKATISFREGSQKK